MARLQIRTVTLDTLKSKILIGILLSALVLISYWGVVENDFVGFDDPLYVTENHQVQKGLNRETVVWAFTTSHACNWHPLTWLSLMLDRELFGLNPAGYHWTNVILHLLGGLILFLALNRMTSLLWPSGMVAALFLLHPLHVESVAWVSERKDVLCGFFWMAGLWCYTGYAKRPAPHRYFWVILTFVCSLLSKPMAVTFPFVLLLLDWWPLRRTKDGQTSWLRLGWEKMPLFILSAAGSVITYLVQDDYKAIATLSSITLGERVANAAVSYVAYITKMIWPAELSAFYPYNGFPSDVYLATSVFLLVAVSTLSILLRKRYAYLFVGWFWFMGTLVPVIGLVRVGAHAIADRYSYLPLIGIFIMIVWGLKDALKGRRWRMVIGGILSISCMVILVILTDIQVGYWKNTATLFNRALQSTERNYMAHHIVGQVMAKSGDFGKAEHHYREAIRIRSEFKYAYNSYGHLLMILGRQDEASSQIEKVLKIDPNFAPALKTLGDVRMRQGRIKEAVPFYQKALLYEKEDWELFNNYGIALFFTGNVKEAVSKIQEAIRLKPDYAEARENLVKILKRGEVP